MKTQTESKLTFKTEWSEQDFKVMQRAIIRHFLNRQQVYNGKSYIITSYRQLDAKEDEFMNDILEDYRIMLQHELEYLTSEEAIIETIKANEYTFEANGEMRNF